MDGRVGLDIHDKRIAICVRSEGGQIVRRAEVRSIDEIMRILEALPDRFEVCYEASCGYGHYHDLLSPIAARVTVAHPGRLRLIFRSKDKNDRKDAERLAKSLYLGEAPAVHVAAADVRTRRELITRRGRVIAKRTRAKNSLGASQDSRVRWLPATRRQRGPNWARLAIRSPRNRGTGQARSHFRFGRARSAHCRSTVREPCVLGASARTVIHPLAKAAHRPGPSDMRIATRTCGEYDMHDLRPDRRAFLGTLAAVGISGPIVHRPSFADDAKPDPVGLARKVETLYASCRTYRDRGKVNLVVRDARGQEKRFGEIKQRKITTAFVRPDKFRFEFDDERGGKLIRNLIWMGDGKVRTWWDIQPRVETPMSLESALGAAAGVTESSSVTIPPLLLPRLLNRPKALSGGPGKLSLFDDEAIGPHACRRLRRRFEALNFQTKKNFEVVVTYWIDAKTSAIRRVVQETELDEFRGVGTLDLEPEFDVALPVAALAFDPPESKP
jgi:hypothetical protein